jgi:hypothetical protein
VDISNKISNCISTLLLLKDTFLLSPFGWREWQRERERERERENDREREKKVWMD